MPAGQEMPSEMQQKIQELEEQAQRGRDVGAFVDEKRKRHRLEFEQNLDDPNLFFKDLQALDNHSPEVAKNIIEEVKKLDNPFVYALLKSNARRAGINGEVAHQELQKTITDLTKEKVEEVTKRDKEIEKLKQDITAMQVKQNISNTQQASHIAPHDTSKQFDQPVASAPEAPKTNFEKSLLMNTSDELKDFLDISLCLKDVAVPQRKATSAT